MVTVIERALLRNKVAVTIIVAIIVAIIGTPRPGNFGIPIGSAYHDYLFFAGILDHSAEFTGTVFLDMANRLSATTVLVNLVRTLSGLGIPYVLQAAFFSFIGNFTAVAGILYLSFLLTRSLIFPIIALLAVIDHDVIFKYQILSSTLASQFALLLVALLAGGRYRFAGAITGIVGLAHPIFPPVMFCFSTVFFASCGKMEQWWERMRQYLSAALLFGLPWLLIMMLAALQGTVTTTIDTDEWITFLRAVNQLPFVAMNPKKFGLLCAFLLTMGLAFFLTGRSDSRQDLLHETREAFRGLSFLFAVSLFFVLFQGLFTEVFQTVIAIKLSLHHRVLPIMVPLTIIGVSALCFNYLRVRGRLAWFPLLIYVLYLPKAEWAQLIGLGVSVVFLFSLERIPLYCKVFDRMACRLKLTEEQPLHTPIAKIGISVGTLLVAYMLTNINVGQLMLESPRDWKRLISGELEKEKFKFRANFLQYINVGERVMVVPLREDGQIAKFQISKFLSFAPLRANFIEQVEMTYLLYSPALLSSMKQKMMIYGTLDWKGSKSPSSIARRYNSVTFDEWGWRRNIGVIQEIDPKVKYLVTQRKFTCEGEQFLTEEKITATRDMDIVLLRLSDAKAMNSCKKWQDTQSAQ